MRATVMLFRTLFPALGLAMLTAALAEAATVRTSGPFNLTFYDDTEGVDYAGALPAWQIRGDQNWSSDQMDAVEAAIVTWDERIENVPGRLIEVHVYWNNLAGSALHKSTNPSFGNAGSAEGWNYAENVWRDGATNPGPFTGFDTLLQLDTNAAGAQGGWNFGPGVAAADQYDFRSVVARQIGHSLFAPTYHPGTDTWGHQWGSALRPDEWAGAVGLSRWDDNLVDAAGNRPQIFGPGIPSNFNQIGDVFFEGASAAAFNDGNLEVYAPSPYQDNVSLSYLDAGAFPNLLVNSTDELGPAPRRLTPVEWKMLSDMGWTVVPEPGSVAMLLGLLAITLIRRRRRK